MNNSMLWQKMEKFETKHKFLKYKTFYPFCLLVVAFDYMYNIVTSTFSYH